MQRGGNLNEDGVDLNDSAFCSRLISMSLCFFTVVISGNMD